MTKKCYMCGKILSLDMFYRNKTKSDGLTSECKKCAKTRTKNYALNNPEQIKAYRKEYHQKNKDQIIAKVNKWQQENPERTRENKRRSAENLKEQRTSKLKTRYHSDEKFKARIKANMKRYTSSDKGRLKELEKNERRRAKVKSLECSFTPEDWLNCLKHFNNHCAYCGKDKSLTRDHFIPLSNNGEYTINNVIPSCKSCNSKKHNLDFFDWYPKQPFYSKQRELKILKYLNYDPTTKIQQLALC